MQAVNDQIEALAATVAALTPQIPQKNQEMIDKNELSSDLLHEAGDTYADKLGLRFTVPLVVQNIITSSVSIRRKAVATTAEPCLCRVHLWSTKVVLSVRSTSIRTTRAGRRLKRRLKI